jgi:hypothetical protein
MGLFNGIDCAGVDYPPLRRNCLRNANERESNLFEKNLRFWLEQEQARSWKLMARS